jgi:hypothetical protein
MSECTQVTRWVWCNRFRQHKAMFRDDGGGLGWSASAWLTPEHNHRPIPPEGEDGPEIEEPS